MNAGGLGRQPVLADIAAATLVKTLVTVELTLAARPSGGVSTVRMKDPNGFHVDVSQVPVPQDMTIIRMNVDDFEEAKAILERHGFVNRNAGQRVDSGSSISEFMVSPAGLSINLVKHIKKED